MSAITDEYAYLVDTHWRFFQEEWPAVVKAKFHRTEMKEISDIARVKSTALNRLSFISTFFFLTQVFGKHVYGSPYRNVEKGLVLLYALITGESLSDMSRFLPKTSFYNLHRGFYLREPDKLHYGLSSMLRSMCFSLKLRLLLAKYNPDP